jgi:hypothetical protein
MRAVDLTQERNRLVRIPGVDLRAGSAEQAHVADLTTVMKTWEALAVQSVPLGLGRGQALQALIHPASPPPPLPGMGRTALPIRQRL